MWQLWRVHDQFFPSERRLREDIKLLKSKQSMKPRNGSTKAPKLPAHNLR